MRWIGLLLFFSAIQAMATSIEIVAHPNNGKYALKKGDSLISDYVFTEISEFTEGKAYASKGELYAYIDTNGKALCPYIFAQAYHFKGGFAVAGDSNYLGLINEKMQVVVPFRFKRILSPDMGLIRVQSVHGLWGAYDKYGDVRLPAIYDYPPQILDLERIIVVREGLYGIVNDCHETIYNTSYQYISREGYAYRSGKYLRIFRP